MGLEMARSRWFIILLCSLAGFFLTTVNIFFSPILLIIKDDLGLTYTQSSLFITAYYIGYTIGQIPWGYFADKLRASRAIFYSVLGLAVTTLLSSIATTGNVILILRSIAGFLGAGIFVPGIRLVSGWFSTDKRGLAIGFLVTASSIGGIFVSFFSPILSLLLGWRWSIRLLAFLGIIIAVLVGRWLKDSSRKKALSTKAVNLQTLLSRVSFWILGYDQFIRLGFTCALSAWLPTFLTEQHGVTTVIAGLSLTLISVSGIVSNPISGWVADRLGESKAILIAFAVLSPSFLLLATNTNASFTWLLIALLSFFINFLRSPLFAVLPKLYGLQHSGIITGYQNTFASAGAFVFPLVLGILRDTTQAFFTGWLSLSILCLPALLTNITQLKPSQNS